MEQEHNKRTRLIHVRLSPEEFEIFRKGLSATYCRNQSDYIRRIITGTPHIGRVRNESQDRLMKEIVGLRDEFKAIGGNLNQITKKLHTLYRIKEMQDWLAITELERRSIVRSIEHMEMMIEKLVLKWLL